MPQPARTIKVWDDSVAPHFGVCRGCQGRIWWARTVANDKAICFDSVPAIVRTEPTQMADGSFRTIRVVDQERVHWPRCKGADALRRSR
jgi:hypothetical protein